MLIRNRKKTLQQKILKKSPVRAGDFFYILYRFNIMNISVTSIEFIGLNFAVHITFATFSYYFLEKRCTKHLKEIKTIYLNNNNKILERKLQ